MRSLVSIDFETTGLNFVNDYPVQWAVTKIDSVQGKTQFKTLSGYIKTDIEISSTVEQLTGLSYEFLNENGVSYDEGMLQCIEAIGLSQEKPTDSIILVGHNVLNFDIHFLEMAAAKLGYYIPDTKYYWDTAAHYKAQQLGLKKNVNESIREYHQRALGTYAKGIKFKLPIVCEHLGIPLTAHHDAVHDANAALMIAIKQMSSFPEAKELFE